MDRGKSISIALKKYAETTHLLNLLNLKLKSPQNISIFLSIV